MAQKILIADDDQIVHESLGIYLKAEGFETVDVFDGEAALQNLSPDVVLCVLDIMMPKMTGIEVCREIRKTSQLPILMLTAKGEEIDRIVGKVWLVSSLSLIPIFLFSLFHGLSYRHSLFELITLVMATATATTGMIVRSKIYIVAGLTCMALSVLFPLYDYFLKKIATSDGIEITAGLLNNEILIFAGVFFIMMVVPGHIINYQSHKRCSRN